MTAEIVIMNKESVAMATDSAVTSGESGNEKIFPSANKLFTLSKYQPVGIMVYGNATLMGVPWETIIKVYRNRLSRTRFNTLEEYANNFIYFLDNGNPMFPDSVQDEYVKETIYTFFDYIKEKVRATVHAAIDEKGTIDDDAIKLIMKQEIKNQYINWNQTKNIPSIPLGFNRNMVKKYGKIIEEAINKVFEELPLSLKQLNQLRKIASSLFSKFPENITKGDISGVVIAGFGDQDNFPVLKSIDVEGIANNKLKYDTRRLTKIDFDMSASINPFAQIDMVQTFMEGVDPFYQEAAESYLSKIMDDYSKTVVDCITKYSDQEKEQLKGTITKMVKEILADYSGRLGNYRQQKNVDPILGIVSVLPKDELAAMAESLVNLTSFKRKVTMERETVGGPVDVAVISKGDGFIWIKRKHYFRPELNPQFFANYYKETKYDQDEE